MFSHHEIGKVAAAAVGALLLSSIAIGAALGPATATVTAPPAYAAAAVGQAHG